MLAKAVGQLAMMLAVPPSSRASSLPQFFPSCSRVSHSPQIPLWERACSRKRWVIQHWGWLSRRLREQARSHIFSELSSGIAFTTGPLWERACSRKRWVSLHQYWMCRRLREQARSHNGIGVRPGEPGRLSGRLANKLCSHRFDGCTTGRARSATRPPREQALLPQI